MPATISQQIRVGKNVKIAENSLRLRQLIKISDETALILNTKSILSPYRNELKKYISTYKLSDQDIKTFQYRPELLSWTVYGTTELTGLILQINHMVSATEFCNLENGLKLFNSSIIDFLNEVIIKEKPRVKQNRIELERDLLQ
jgi:hypothetical protein